MPLVLLSVFVSLLPQRYRGHWLADGNLDVRRGAILSSVVQFVGCSAAMWALYPSFLHRRLAEASAAAAASHPGDKLVEGMLVFAAGQFAALEYMFRPQTVALLYFVVEGAVRIVSTVASDAVLPTLPLQLVAWAHDYVGFRYREFHMGPRIADLVEPAVAGKYDLKVSSCRPKDWNRLVTIVHNDQMYEVQEEATGAPPRPFVYLLRRKPDYKVVRGLREYDPQEALYRSGWADMAERQHH